MKPYILVAAKSTARLTDAVNDYIADGYEPTGAPWADHKSLPFQVERAPGAKVFQPKEKVWYQAMFRDPDMFDEREVTTPQPHQDAVDDAILEAFYSDNYPGHPDYKGEVTRTDDQMEANFEGSSDSVLDEDALAALEPLHEATLPCIGGPLDGERYKVYGRFGDDVRCGALGETYRWSSMRISGPKTGQRHEVLVHRSLSQAEAENLVMERMMSYFFGEEMEGTHKCQEYLNDLDRRSWRDGIREWALSQFIKDNPNATASGVCEWAFRRLLRSDKERDWLRESLERAEKERGEAIERAERAEKRIEKEWWPNGRPAPEGSPILKGDKPTNCYTTKEPVNAKSSDLEDLEKKVDSQIAFELCKKMRPRAILWLPNRKELVRVADYVHNFGGFRAADVVFAEIGSQDSVTDRIGLSKTELEDAWLCKNPMSDYEATL